MEYNTPVIIGVNQYIQPKNTRIPLDPLRLMEKTSQMAIADTESKQIKEYIDMIYVPRIISWSYRDIPEELGEILGIKLKQSFYSDFGGEIPQKFLIQAAKLIAAGKSKASLIVGAEAFYAANKGKKGLIDLDWPKKIKSQSKGSKKRPDYSDLELKYEVSTPSNMYAMFETAIRHESSRSMEEHLNHIGKLLEPFSEVASKNPHAWTREKFSAEEITTPSQENRLICHPYTKRMTANLYVDQSAALIMTSNKIADDLNIDKKKRIYPLGGACLENIHIVTQRPRLYDSPALREASRLALDQAGLSISEIDKFDIYSCFPSIIQIAKQELGIRDDDPRDLSITGGLNFFGGPYNNYSLHAIVTAVDLIRKNSSLKLMIVANGGYNTRQSVGIYGGNPTQIPWNNRDDTKIQDQIYKETLPEPVVNANGLLTIEAYTITYDKEGKPTKGIIIGRLENERRVLANIKATPEILQKLENIELVGKQCKIYSNHEKNHVIIPDFE